MRILVTGGAGYLGSHACVALLADGHDVVIVDDLSNAHAEVVHRIDRVAGRTPELHRLDLRDRERLFDLFATSRFDAVMHFAGAKAVGESVQLPLKYYDNNVHATTVLLEAMQRHEVFRLVFSSSAAIYGDRVSSPVREESPAAPSSPYGWTKAMIEQILRDVAATDERWQIAVLRYFNPVGAHPSGLLGEAASSTASNLAPRIARVALGHEPFVSIFGDDYPTPDGTGLRDYLHVADLVAGHLAALAALDGSRWRLREWNLGTGEPLSVLALVRAFGSVVGRELPYRVMPRRPGDVAVMFADPARSAAELGWRATRTVENMVVDAWRWHTSRPGDQPSPA